MTTFVGRFAELRKLSAAWNAVTAGGSARTRRDPQPDPDEAPAATNGSSTESSATGPGQCVLLTGAAGVGKTRLVGEFLRRNQLRAFWYAGPEGGGAARGADAQSAIGGFVEAAAQSGLQRSAPFRDILAPDWDTALKLLADAVGDEPAIVALDSLDAILSEDQSFAVALRRAWTRVLAEKPVLLILIGRSMGPIARELGDGVITVTVRPFNPAELREVLDLGAAAAFDAHIISGGHPDIAAQWRTGASPLDALALMLSRSPSVFEVRAPLAMAQLHSADAGLGSQAEFLLAAAGSDENSRATIGRVAALPPASLDRALKALVASGHMVADRPVSTRPSREARYRLADPYLRFWLQTIRPHREEIARGNMDAVLTAIRDGWPSWRAKAFRIIARDAMDRLAATGSLPGTGAVGGYWTRFEDVRVDLVGTDRAEDPQAVTFVGAVKWDGSAPFDHYDLASLIAVRERVPGVTNTTPLVAVSLAGAAIGDAVAAVLGPEELISAWEA